MKAHVAMDIGDSYPACQWHDNAETGNGAERIRNVAERSLVMYIEQAKEDTPLFQRLEADLRECQKCMYIYHKARVRLTQENPEYDRQLFELEGRRITETLRHSTTDDPYILVPITEVLWHPFLLLSRDIEVAFCTQLLELNESFGLEGYLPERIPSMYLLLIHPRKEIRELAWQCLQATSYHITQNNYEDISPVMQWIISAQTQRSLRLPRVKTEVIRFPNQVRNLPSHLLCIASHTAYWQGVAHLLSSFREDALREGLKMSPCLKGLISSLIEQISDYSNDQAAGSQSPFWCQLQCLTYLMEKLGSSLWQDVPKAKFKNSFETIKLHPVFMPAIKAMIKSNISSGDEQDDALLMQTSSSSEVCVGPTEPFMWMPPYIKSLLDFGQSASDSIAMVINFLCSQLNDLLNLGYHKDELKRRGQKKDLSPLDSLITKLMRTLLKVLQSLFDDSLIGHHVGTVRTRMWLETFVAFLNRYPPVRSQQGVSVLVGLANDLHQFLIRIFKITQKNKANISRSMKYIKMLGLPQQPSAASSPGATPRKLWEMNKDDSDFEDCVRFVEGTLQEHSLGSRACDEVLSQSLSRRRDASRVPSPFPDCTSKHPHKSKLGRLSVTPKSSKGGKAPVTNASNEARGNTSPEYASKPFEEATHPPATTSFKVESSRPAKNFKEEKSSSPPIFSSTSLITASSKSTAQPNGSYQGSSDEVILLSDLTSDEESQKSSDDVIFQGSYKEDICEIFSSSSQNEDGQNDSKDSVVEESPCSQRSKWLPSVALEVIPELKDMSETKGQFIIRAVDPLSIRRVETQRVFKRDLETTDSESSLTCVNIWGDIHLKPTKRKKKRCVVREFLSSSEDEEDTQLERGCEERKILAKAEDKNTKPKHHHQVLNSPSSSENEDTKPSFPQLSTPEKKPSTQTLRNSSVVYQNGAWHSSPKYPRNRLSLSRRKQKSHSPSMMSSSDESKAPSVDIAVCKKERWEDCTVEIKTNPLSDCEAGFLPAEHCRTSPMGVREDENGEWKEDKKMQSCPEENIGSSAQLILSDDQVLDGLNSAPSPMSVNCNSLEGEERVSDSDASEKSESLLHLNSPIKKQSLPYLLGDSSDSNRSGTGATKCPAPKQPIGQLLSSLYSSDSDCSNASHSSIVLPPINIYKDDPLPAKASEHQTGDSEHPAPDQEEDIKPNFHFVKVRSKSASHSNQGFSDSYSYTEDRCDSDSFIDLENYNCSELYVEDSLIEISSDDGVDLDASADELEIDLNAVKKEKDDDSHPPDPSTLTEQACWSRPSFLLEDQDCLIAHQGDEDPVWCDDDSEVASSNQQDEAGDEASEDEGSEKEERTREERLIEEVEDLDVEERQPHWNSPTSCTWYETPFPNAPPDDDEERLPEEVRENDSAEEPLHIPYCLTDGAALLSAVQDDDDDTYFDEYTCDSWKNQEAQEEGRNDEVEETEEMFAKDTATGKSFNIFEMMQEREQKNSEKRKKKKKKGQLHARDGKEIASACRRSSLHVVSTSGPSKATHSTNSNSGLPYDESPLSAPRSPLFKVQGSWKPSSFREPEFTPVDAQPLIRFRGSDEEPVLTDTYVLDSSQPQKKRHNSNTEEERPRAAVQSCANRFSSRTGNLCDEMKKGLPSAPKGNRDEPRGGGVLKRIRRTSGPPTIQQTVASLAPSTSTTLPLHFESLPPYAKHAYAPSNVTRYLVPPTVQAQSSTKGQVFSQVQLNGCASGPNAEVTTNDAGADRLGQQTETERKSPADNDGQAISQPRFQFFTSDPQTANTASSLPYLISSNLLSNATANSSNQSPSSRPSFQQIIHQPEKPEMETSPSTRVQEPSPLPTVPLQPQAAVLLPKTSRFSIEDLYYWVIGWNSQWLDIYGPQSESQQPTSVPPILAECPYKTLGNVPNSFNLFEDYRRTFVPLLLHEIWAQMQNKSDSGQPNFEADFKECKCQEERQNGFLLSCTFRVTAANGTCPINYQDVVKVSSRNDAAYSYQPLLAFVTMMPVILKSADLQEQNDHDPLVNGQIPQESAEKLFEVSLLILAKNEEIYRSLSSNTGHKVHLKVLHSLVSAVRQFQGLISLPKCGLLASDILRYRRMDVFCPAPSSTVPTANPAMQEKIFDKFQLQAINVASRAVAEPDTLPRICLIQGAPGTGKTKVVIGLVKKILASQKENQYQRCLPGQQSTVTKPPPILLCAPSNPSINVLLRRLTVEIPTTFLHETQPSHQDEAQKKFHVVRVGRSSLIHESVRKFSLESQVQAKKNQKATEISLNQERKMEKRKKFELAITKLEKTSATCRSNGNSKELQKRRRELITDLHIVEGHLKDLKRQKVDLDCRPNAHYEQAILENANIICCTVNVSGSELLREICGRDGKCRKMKFSCVIVDEANQCSELDTIIPLQKCSMKVVLIGDSQMPSATVVSKEAGRRGLHRSLFDRLCRWFQSAKPNPPVIHVLKSQHRMHTDIVAFPSKHFYAGQLQSDKITAKRRVSFFLRPYLVFDVVQSRETQISSRAFTNDPEAKMVLDLYQRICLEKMKNRNMVDKVLNVGIIVPYKDQAAYLSLCQKKVDRELVASPPPEGFKLPAVEIATMDQFKGRERDVIIVSHVRTQGPSENQDLSSDHPSCFIGNRKRMNFVLTRAKYSVFIVAHVSTLLKNGDWRALVADAHQRKLIVQVQKNSTRDAAKHCSKHHRVPLGKVVEADPGAKTKTQEGDLRQADMCRNAVGEARLNQEETDKSTTASSTQGSHSVHSSTSGSAIKGGAGKMNLPLPVSSATSSDSTKTVTSQQGFHPLKHKLPSRLTSDETGTSNGQHGVKEPPAKSSVSAKAKQASKSSKKKVRFQTAAEPSLVPKPMQGNREVQTTGKKNPYKVALIRSPNRSRVGIYSPKLHLSQQAFKKRLLMGRGSPLKHPQSSPIKMRGSRSGVQPLASQGSPSTSLGKQPGHVIDARASLHASGRTDHASPPSLLNTTESLKSHREYWPPRSTGNPKPGSKYFDQGRICDTPSTSSAVQIQTSQPVNSPMERLPGQPPSTSQAPPGYPDQLRRTVENLKRKQGQEKRTLQLSGLQPDPKLVRRRQKSGPLMSAPDSDTANSNGPRSPSRV